MTLSDAPSSQCRWVWYCSDASIENRQVSVLAFVEVLLANTAYWWIALHFDWPWFTLVGLLAAPMLLLRSTESMALGVEMLRQWSARTEDDVSRWGKWLMVFVVVVAGQGLMLWIVWALVRYATEWSLALVWWVVLSGMAPAAVARALMGAVAGSGVVDDLIRVIAKNNTWAYWVFAPGIAAGALLAALYIRLYATLRHPLKGISRIPNNWRENLAAIDFLHPPELIPLGSTVSPLFSVRSLLRLSTGEHFVNRIGITLLITAWYLPALAYRWSIKASAWLWLPLALLLTPPFQWMTSAERRESAAHLTNGAWAFPVLLPLTVLAWLALSAWPGFSAWLSLLPEIGKSAQTLADLLSAPKFGILTLLLSLSSLLALVLWWQRTNLYAAWNIPLGSDDSYFGLSDKARARFDIRATSLERLRLWLTATLLLLGEASAVAFFHKQNPALAEQLFWPWLLAWL